MRPKLFLMAALCGALANADVIAANATGSVPIIGFVGQSFVTPNAVVPWDHITVSFITPGLVLPAAPVAAGTLFLLSQEFAGTPNALSSATAGFIASAPSAANLWTFASNITLNPNTTYYVYGNAAFGLSLQTPLGSSLQDAYADGQAYYTALANLPFGIATALGVGAFADLKFNVTAAPIPEPSTLAILALSSIAGLVLRKRKS